MTESFVFDGSFAPSMLNDTLPAGPSPKAFVSGNLLPSDARRPTVQFHTPAIMPTPALPRGSKDEIFEAFESLNQMQTQLNTRLDQLDDKLDMLTRSMASRDTVHGAHAPVAYAGPVSGEPVLGPAFSQLGPQSTVHSAIHSTVQAGMAAQPSYPGIPATSVFQGAQPSQGPQTPSPSTGVTLSPQSLIMMTPDQLDRLVEDKVSAKIVKFQRDFVEQSLMEMRLRTLESTVDNISRNLSSLSGLSGMGHNGTSGASSGGASGAAEASATGSMGSNLPGISSTDFRRHSQTLDISTDIQDLQLAHARLKEELAPHTNPRGPGRRAEELRFLAQPTAAEPARYAPTSPLFNFPPSPARTVDAAGPRLSDGADASKDPLFRSTRRSPASDRLSADAIRSPEADTREVGSSVKPAGRDRAMYAPAFPPAVESEDDALSPALDAANTVTTIRRVTLELSGSK